MKRVFLFFEHNRHHLKLNKKKGVPYNDTTNFSIEYVDFGNMFQKITRRYRIMTKKFMNTLDDLNSSKIGDSLLRRGFLFQIALSNNVVRSKIGFVAEMLTKFDI